MNWKKMFLAGGIAALAMTNPAHAAPVQLVGGINILEDDNIEYFLRPDGSFAQNSDTLSVGMRLRAVISFTEVQDSATNTVQTLGAPGRELTGLSEIEVVAVSGGTLIFGPSAAFVAEVGVLGAMGVAYTQNPGNFSTSCNTSGIVADCESLATDGSHWMTIGFGDPDDFWVAEGVGGVDLSTITIGAIKAAGGASKLGVANYALSILENNTGYEFEQQFSPGSAALGIGPAIDKDGFVDIVGSGDVLGGAGLTDPWAARSDFDFQLVRVPEPATAGLLGLALLGVGFAARRRKATSTAAA